MAKQTRVHWFDLNIIGNKWMVFLASPTDKDMHGLDGCCLPNDTVILIDWELSDQQIKATLFHELLHAIFTASGFDRIVPEMIGKTEEEWTNVEETLVRLLGPQIVDTLERNGWPITLPPKPELPLTRGKKKTTLH